jgi:hypothetical protein
VRAQDERNRRSGLPPCLVFEVLARPAIPHLVRPRAQRHASVLRLEVTHGQLQGCILGRHPPLEGDTARACHFHVGGKAAVFAVEANELLEVGDDSHSVVRGCTTSYSLRSLANRKRSRGSLANLPKYQAS